MLGGQALLQAWEVGLRQHPVDRALTVLTVAYPELAWDTLASLSIGERDRYLFQVREQTFGSAMVSRTACPTCSEQLEFEMRVRDVIVDTQPQASEATWQVMVDDYEMHVRRPTSFDLGAIVGCSEVGQARHHLAQRCIVRLVRGGETVAMDSLPKTAIDSLAASIGACDPQAEILLDLRCPACEHGWQMMFDIEAFLWSEICAQAKRLLCDVHTLARAYGWREADILRLNETRRQLYLEMVGNG